MIKPRYLAQVTCPYCGNQFNQVFEAEVHDPDGSPRLSTGIQEQEVILCDTMDSPGCDRYFVVKKTLWAKTETFRIEYPLKEPPPTP